MEEIMNLEETIKELAELELKFEGLKDTMEVFQGSINNSFYWFFAVVGIFFGLLAVVGVALYFIVQNAINKGVKKGIDDVTSTVQKEISSFRDELRELKESQEQKIADIISDNEKFISNLDHHVIQLINNNPQIKWTKGRQSSFGVKDDILRLRGFVGIIDWESPIISVELIDSKTSEPIEFEIIDRYNDGMDLKLEKLEKDRIIFIDYTFVWTVHDIN